MVSLFLSCRALSSPTICRFIPAHCRAPTGLHQLGYLFRRCSHAERPFGPESFVAEFEEKLGRRWKRWTFDKELVDSELSLILDQITPKAPPHRDFVPGAQLIR